MFYLKSISGAEKISVNLDCHLIGFCDGLTCYFAAITEGRCFARIGDCKLFPLLFLILLDLSRSLLDRNECVS